MQRCRELYMNNGQGNILLMVLVIVSMLAVMFVSSISLIARELHATADATQEERAYQVAEAGMQKMLFWIKDAGYTLDQMVAKSGTSTAISDTVTGSTIGSYTLTITKLAAPDAGLNVVSTGKSPDLQFCSQVKSVLKSPSGNAAGPFLAYGWTQSAC